MTPERPRPNRDLVYRDVGDELMFYEREGDRVHILNGTARAIFHLCDGARSVEEIADAVRERFEVDADTARRDVHEAIERMVSLGIVEPG